ncbi:MAG TPA: hypothetical protein VHK67_06795 [Rhabdochlamydiaceae bacterium]|jgi:hypothetical protein|nr:hypothetical protein [Rhabdochlamydiaceae bacterium]
MRLSGFKFNASSLLVWMAGVLMAGFLISSSIDLWGYLRLEKKSSAKIEQWKVVEKDPSQFAIKAYFSFETASRAYQGKTTFSKPYHLNRLSAENQIKIYSKQPCTVWYQSSNPERASIEHIFPFKKCLYSLMLIGIFFYFVYLRHQIHSQIATD